MDKSRGIVIFSDGETWADAKGASVILFKNDAINVCNLMDTGWEPDWSKIQNLEEKGEIEIREVVPTK